MKIDMNNLPNHVAIIMDGNRRWAKSRMLPVVAGHKQGFEALKSLVKGMSELGIKHLTVYAFSTENWRRAQEEVDALMDIFRDAIALFKKEFQNGTYKVDFIGSQDKLADDIVEGAKEVTENTKNNTGINVHIALNYGGRDEIIRAARKMIKNIKSPEEITEENFEKYLDTYGISSPDLVIRTSGEKRLSNFLLWQVAYSEFYFVDKLWPDFTIDDLKKAIYDFQKRNRRFGGI